MIRSTISSPADDCSSSSIEILLRPGTIDRQRAVEREHVEHVQLQRLLDARFLDLASAPKPPHQILKRGRPPRRVDADHFAVEDRVTRADSIHNLDHVGNALGDLIQPARENSHAAIFVARMMYLHARAVELVLERQLRAQRRERFGDIVNRKREHRLERLDARAHSAKTSLAADFSVPARRAQIIRTTRPRSASSMCMRRTSATGRAPSSRSPRASAPRSPVAHLADQNLRDVLAFERRGAREQLAQRVELAVARVTPLDRGDLGEFFIELANRQRRFGIAAREA